MISLQQVPKESVEQLWEGIDLWVKSAIGVDRSYTSNDIKILCAAGNLTLWKITINGELKGFLTTSLIPAPQGLTCYAPWLGGIDLGEWVKPGFEQLKQWMRSKGCISFSWIGRKAWQRLVDADYEGVFYLINL